MPLADVTSKSWNCATGIKSCSHFQSNTILAVLWRWFGIRDFCRSVKISLRQSPIGLPLWELECSHRGYHRNKCQLTKADKLKWRKDDDCKPWSRYMVHSSKSPQKYNRGVSPINRDHKPPSEWAMYAACFALTCHLACIASFTGICRSTDVRHLHRIHTADDKRGTKLRDKLHHECCTVYARQVFFDDENDLIQSLCTLWSLSGRWHGHWQREGSLYAAHTHTRAY